MRALLAALALVALPADALAIPASKTYDFAGISPGSTTHVAWAHCATADPFDFKVLAPAGEVEFNSSCYTSVSTDDTFGCQCVSDKTAGHMRYRFRITEAASSVTSLRPYWIGFHESDMVAGSPVLVNQDLYLWNFATSRWELLASQYNTRAAELDGGRIVSSPSSYVDSTGDVFLLVFADSTSQNRTFHGDYVRLVVEYDAAGTAPAAPAALGQFQSDGTTAIATGGASTSRTVVFKGTVTDADAGATLRLAVEVRPLDVAFTGVATAVGTTAVASGAQASVTVSNLPGGPYHWQAWGVDERGAPGTAAAYGGNAESATDVSIPGGGCLLNDRFEENPFGTNPTGWTLTAGAGTSFTIDDRLSTSGTNAVRFSDASATATLSAVRSFAASTIVVADFRIYPTGLNDFTSIFLDDAATADKAIQVYVENGALWWWSASDVEVGQLDVNRWHHLRIVADTASDLADVYVNDMSTPKKRGLPFLNAASDLSRLVIEADNASAASTFFDDVQVRDGACAAYAAPATPALRRPWNDARTSDATPDLFYELPASTGTYHTKIVWALDREFTNGVVRRDTTVSATGFAPSVPLDTATATRGWYRVGAQAGDALVNGQTYWWRAAVRQGTSNSAWSEPRSFTIDTTRTSPDWFVTAGAQFESGASLSAVRSSNDGLVLPSDGTVNWALSAHGSTTSASTAQDAGPSALLVDGAVFPETWTARLPPTFDRPVWTRVDFGQVRRVGRFEFVSGGDPNVIPRVFQLKTYPAAGCTGAATVYPTAGTNFTNTATTWSFTPLAAVDIGCMELVIKCVTGNTDAQCTNGTADFYAWVDEFRAWNVQPSSGTWRSEPIRLSDFPGASPEWRTLAWNGTVPGAAVMEARVETSTDGVAWSDAGLSSLVASGSLSLASIATRPWIRLAFNFTKGSTPHLASVSVDGNAAPLAAGTSLHAWREGTTVRVEWITSDESGILAFDVLRGDDVEGAERLNGDAIAARGSLAGGVYEWVDESATHDPPRYWLVEYLADGTTRVVGPATAPADAAEAGAAACACSFVATRPFVPIAAFAWLALAVALTARRRR